MTMMSVRKHRQYQKGRPLGACVETLSRLLDGNRNRNGEVQWRIMGDLDQLKEGESN